VGALVDAVAGRLPGHRLHTGHALRRVVDHGDHVALWFADGRCVQARRLVLTLPPRLVAERLDFSPALDAARQAVLAQTPTWMAAAAKAAVRTARAPWRGQRGAGNAWVTHAQAVLAELWDSGRPDPATDTDPEAPGALAGFYAIGAGERPAFRRSAAVLLESAFAMVHGPRLLPIEPQVQDWAEEPWTCSALDRAEDGRLAQHPVYGDPLLQAAAWDGRLWFGGSETAAQGGGYLEGALAAAARLRRQLTEAANEPSGESAGESSTDASASPPSACGPAVDGRAVAPQPAVEPVGTAQAGAAALLDDFVRRVAGLREQALERYRQRVHLALSRQQDAQLTQRAVLGALESVYQEALGLLGSLRLPAAGQPLQQGRHALTPQVLAPFKGLADELLAEVVRYNATSCALSNFPFEHKPSAEYVHVIRRDLAAAWQDFALAANDHLKAHA
jgi:monoamine oxidase